MNVEILGLASLVTLMIGIILLSLKMNVFYVYYFISSEDVKQDIQVSLVEKYISHTLRHTDTLRSLKSISSIKIYFCIAKTLPLSYIWLKGEESPDFQMVFLLYSVSLLIYVGGVFMECRLIKNITSQ